MICYLLTKIRFLKRINKISSGTSQLVKHNKAIIIIITITMIKVFLVSRSIERKDDLKRRNSKKFLQREIIIRFNVQIGKILLILYLIKLAMHFIANID